MLSDHQMNNGASLILLPPQEDNASWGENDPGLQGTGYHVIHSLIWEQNYMGFTVLLQHSGLSVSCGLHALKRN